MAAIAHRMAQRLLDTGADSQIAGPFELPQEIPVTSTGGVEKHQRRQKELLPGVNPAA